MIKIKKGLDLPISGSPEQRIVEGNPVKEVALIGFDYIGMKPTMAVREGDQVKKGQLLFEDKKTQGVRYTSPASGRVKQINRGERRVFESMIIEIEGDESVTFKQFPEKDLPNLDRQQVQDNLLESGLWTSIRTRPYSKVPLPGSEPHSIFVTAMDTNPLSADPKLVIGELKDDFNNGLTVLKKLTDGKVFVCAEPGFKLRSPQAEVEVKEFSGCHPAGNAGTHIHFLDPVNATKTVWVVGYQDVIAIGKLFTTGELYVNRVVALSGSCVSKPRLVRTRIGANLSELTQGELSADKPRIISGSVFGGRTATGTVNYLGRYANQITVIEESNKRELLAWMSPGMSKFSVLNIYLSKLFSRKPLTFNTSTNGSERALVSVGNYEEVMPLDILATPLLISLIVGDTEQAQLLGCLELDEEDLALCTFVCAGKYEYGPILRENLSLIEKEG